MHQVKKTKHPQRTFKDWNVLLQFAAALELNLAVQVNKFSFRNP